MSRRSLADLLYGGWKGSWQSDMGTMHHHTVALVTADFVKEVGFCVSQPFQPLSTLGKTPVLLISAPPSFLSLSLSLSLFLSQSLSLSVLLDVMM